MAQMTDHTLDIVHGIEKGNNNCLEATAKLSSEVTISPVYAGRVVHLNNSDEFEMGATGSQMPIFLTTSSNLPSVSNEGGTDWEAAFPRARMSGIVATGGFEVESTEHDPDQTYTVNQPLRAVASNTNATTGGRLTNQGITVYTNCVCGIVSKAGRFKNHHSKYVIRFWTVFLPGTAGN